MADGRLIAITGASSGLGRAIERRFARDGETVIVLGRRRAQLESVAAECGASAHPIVCDVAAAEIAFDNFRGRWGDQGQLDRFLQGYAIEMAKIEARKKGHVVTEQPLEDGSVKLTINVGGVAG